MVTRKKAVRWMLPVLVLILLVAIAAPIAQAQDYRAEGLCLDAVSDSGVNCTANDLTFVLLGLGVADDGCVSPTDTAAIYLQATIRNSTAQNRYDLGIWVANDGMSAKTGGMCTRVSVVPSTAVTSDPACYPNDPAGTGPYLNLDGDDCADLSNTSNETCTGDEMNGAPNDNLQPDTIYTFAEPVTLACVPSSNGFVAIPSCLTYGNGVDQVDDARVLDSQQGRTDDADSDCTDVWDISAGTAAKCQCDDVLSNVPAPDLFCSSDGQPGPTEGMMACAIQNDNGNGLLDNGETTRCTVYYNNQAATCLNPTPTPAENLQCATVAYIQFEIDYDETRGSVSNIVAGDGGTTGIATSYLGGGDQVIRWDPMSLNNTLDIIGPQRSFSLTFDYTLDTNNSSTADLNFTMNTFWNWNAPVMGVFDDPRQQDMVTCTTSVSTTPVTVAHVASRRAGAGLDVEWTTATETANVGFNVFVESDDGWRKVNDELILSHSGDSFTPSDYRFTVPESAAGQRFLIEDVDASGRTRRHGPFRVGAQSGHRAELMPIDWQAVHEERTAERRGARGIWASSKGGNGGGKPGIDADLRTEGNGLVRVGYDDLVAAGIDPSRVAANTLAMFNQGASVPFDVVANGRTFGPGSYLELYAEAIDSFYTTTNVYHLAADRKQAQRMEVESAAPGAGPATDWYLATLTLDDDLGYSVSSPGDPWYLRYLPAGTSPRSTTFSLAATGLVSVPGVAPTIHVELGGGNDLPADPDHHVRVKLNGVTLGEAHFDGFRTQSISAEVPPGLLAASNSLVVEVAADLGLAFDRVFVDSVSLTYPRQLVREGAQFRFRAAGDVLQVADAGASPVLYRLDAGGPVRLTGASLSGGVLSFRGTAAMADYLLVDAAGARGMAEVSPARDEVDLTAGSADYLIIAPGAFFGALQPLVTQRQAQGHSVRMVDVADIYDQYSYGIVDAAAIHDYVIDAVHSMGVHYVLLAGGDTLDYKDALGIGSVSLVPTLYAPTGDLVLWAPVDPLFGDIDGDEVPDVPVGRFPARTVEELQLLVSKTLGYESRIDRSSAVFGADESEPGGVSFTLDSNLMISSLGGSWSADRAYVDSLGFTAARQRLLDDFDSGPALVSYVGHSGPNNWSFSGLLRASDVSALQNLGRPSLVVQWGCWNAFHVSPAYNTLGHRLLLAGDQGAAAVLGSATLLETSSARALSLPFMEQLAAGPVVLGDAVIAAKRQVGASMPGSRDAILGWTLLGDPALLVAP